MNPADLKRFGFLTLPNYSMIACANAIEALRMANRMSGDLAYEWRLLTLDGAPAMASNGLALHPTTPLSSGPLFDIVFVCGGVDVRQATGRPLAAALRSLASKGVSLGALCTGTFALAEAGLLQGRRCAIHWENLDAIREEFPDVDFVDDLYALDTDRITCTGGVAPLDMMTSLIAARFGPDLAHKVSAQFIVERERLGAERQRGLGNLRRTEGHVGLTAALSVLESNSPGSSPLAAAKAAGMSVRQLERLFARHLGETPSTFTRRLRLERARALLAQTAMSVTDVAVACGFTSPAHFATVYRHAFGHTPSAARKNSSKDRPKDLS